MDINLLIEAFTTVILSRYILAIIAGMFLGVIFGSLPGISASMGIVLMLPFTYYMGILPSIILLVALYAGAVYGGSITAILFNTPGTPAAVATTFDGYPMSKNGEAGKALGLAVSSSAIGGVIASIVLLLLAPPLSKIALQIQSAEYFALTFLGIMCIASIGSGDIIKALITGLFGIVLAMVGMDPMTGVLRLTFDNAYLIGGLEFIPVMIGSFALAEVLKQVVERLQDSTGFDTGEEVSVESFEMKELLKYKWLLFKSSIIGTLTGILPGAGGSIASIISYGEAVRSSTNSKKFGEGIPEGVIAPEAANNGAAGGAMIPTLVLGIPGSPTTAIILAALVLQGLQPGPRLMHEQPLMLYAIFLSLLLSSIIVFLGGRIGVKFFTSVLKLPYKVLAPYIIMFSIIGSYAVTNDVFQLWIMIAFGFVGYFMKKYKFSPAALILGLVLGNMMESSFRRQLLLTDGDFLSFFKRPISLAIIIIALLTAFYPIFADKFLNNENK